VQIESSLKPADPEHERIDADAPSRKDKPRKHNFRTGSIVQPQGSKRQKKARHAAREPGTMCTRTHTHAAGMAGFPRAGLACICVASRLD